jgi:hypothetical protein
MVECLQFLLSTVCIVVTDLPFGLARMCVTLSQCEVAVLASTWGRGFLQILSKARATAAGVAYTYRNAATDLWSSRCMYGVLRCRCFVCSVEQPRRCHMGYVSASRAWSVRGVCSVWRWPPPIVHFVCLDSQTFLGIPLTNAAEISALVAVALPGPSVQAEGKGALGMAGSQVVGCTVADQLPLREASAWACRGNNQYSCCRASGCHRQA